MDEGLTPYERLVNELSTSSFMRLWTHPNPVGKGGKELCDCLVVCGPHIIIISVKEIEFRDTGDAVGWRRQRSTHPALDVRRIDAGDMNSNPHLTSLAPGTGLARFPTVRTFFASPLRSYQDAPMSGSPIKFLQRW
jgi:hypothetical protein